MASGRGEGREEGPRWDEAAQPQLKQGRLPRELFQELLRGSWDSKLFWFSFTPSPQELQLQSRPQSRP